MLAALKYKENILNSFYLDNDDITIRRKEDDTLKGKFKKDEVVKPYILKGNSNREYQGIWIPIIGTTIGLHWVLTVLRGIPFKDDNVIDHMDGDILNNSRSNIIVTTQGLNCRNKAKYKNNTTGYTGITFRKDSGKYVIRRTINGKRVFRSHKTLEGAVEILRELEKLGLEDGYTKRHGL